MDWPTTPTAKGEGKSIMELLKQGGPEATQATYLLNSLKTLSAAGFQALEVGTVLQTEGAFFSVPCIMKKGEQLWLLYTYAGEWAAGSENAFVDWLGMVRNNDDTAQVPVLCISTVESKKLSTVAGEKAGVWYKTIGDEVVTKAKS